MAGMEFPEIFMQWANYLLIWVGFGTMAGLLAKAIMPGRDPGGTIATLLIGMAGSVIGSRTPMDFLGGPRVSPLRVIGFPTGPPRAPLLPLFFPLVPRPLFPRGP